MKKVLYLFLGIVLMSLSSCTSIDNWDAPNCTFHGTVIDSYTGEPLLASQNDWQIRIWERSWTGIEGGATDNQDLRIKQDGTYRNTKLFAGTYDMLPYDGPFWPIDTVKNVILERSTEQNFTVTPWMQIIDVSNQVTQNASGEAFITFKFKVRAPLLSKDGLTIPQLREVRVWLSLSPFCGNGADSSIGWSEYTDNNKGRIEQNTAWANVVKVENGGNGTDTSKEFTIGPLRVQHGYTYYVRAGANVTRGSNRYNYSPIEKVVIP